MLKGNIQEEDGELNDDGNYDFSMRDLFMAVLFRNGVLIRDKIKPKFQFS